MNIFVARKHLRLVLVYTLLIALFIHYSQCRFHSEQLRSLARCALATEPLRFTPLSATVSGVSMAPPEPTAGHVGEDDGGGAFGRRAPPELVDDLVGEILLRVKPGQPECLVRASLVCKLWRRLIADPAFRRRYRAFHRARLRIVCTRAEPESLVA